MKDTTFKLSSRLVSTLITVAVGCMIILFIGGSFSIKRMNEEHVESTLFAFVEIIEQQLSQQVNEQEFRHWLPYLLEANSIIEMRLESGTNTLYHYQGDRQSQKCLQSIQRSFPISKVHNGKLTLTSASPYLCNRYDFGMQFSFLLSLILSCFCLYQGVLWLKRQMVGIELLEKRGQMILAGKSDSHVKGDDREWPPSASQALNNLLLELRDAKQDRSRFDTFIRSNTFLDQLTGSANRMLFDSKLESMIQETGAYGGVVFINISAWDELLKYCNDDEQNQFLLTVDEVIKGMLIKYTEALQARYYKATFALLLPNLAYKDITQFLNQLLKQLEKLPLPEEVDSENWIHFGLTTYHQGERAGRLLSEAEIALKSAQLQSSNNWNRYDKQQTLEGERSSVRWRSLFEQQLNERALHFVRQPCFDIDADGSKKLLHYELFARLKDETGKELKASEFYRALNQVGYERKCDQVVLTKALKLLNKTTENYSVNLSVAPFLNRQHCDWFRNYLFSIPQVDRKRLSFEFIENELATHFDALHPVLELITGVGANIIVHQVGRRIVSTYYLKEFDISCVKLHRGLVRGINERTENQLIVRSLNGAISSTGTKLIAVGVESSKEWHTLQHLGTKGCQGRWIEGELLFGNQLETIVKTDKMKAKRNRWRTK